MAWAADFSRTGRSNVTVLGLGELRDKLRALNPLALHAARSALYEFAETVMSRSKEEYCPVDTGTLRSTGHVWPPQVTGSNVSVTLGYGGPAAPYALAVHENPRAGKTGGFSPSGRKYKRYAASGQWKYLETPFKQELPQLPRRLDAAMNAAFGRL